MIQIAKLIIFVYHSLFPSRIRTCRYEPTCSQYALDALSKYGFPKGAYLSLKRLISCHPFSSRPIIDPA